MSGWSTRASGIGIKSSWEQALDDVRAAGGKPYAIPAGASDHRLGGLGFARWAQEVQQQEQELGLCQGKSMAGLIDLIRTGQIGRDSSVLYAHLGGQAALNAYSALFR